MPFEGEKFEKPPIPPQEEGEEEKEKIEEAEEKKEEEIEEKPVEEEKPEMETPEMKEQEVEEKVRYSADMWLSELREGLYIKGIDAESLKEEIADKPNCEDLEEKLNEIYNAYEENGEKIRHFQERVEKLASILSEIMDNFREEIPGELVTAVTAKKEELYLIKTGLLSEQTEIERKHREWIEEARERPTQEEFEKRKEIEEMRKRDE